MNQFILCLMMFAVLLFYITIVKAENINLYAKIFSFGDNLGMVTDSLICRQGLDSFG